MPDIAAAVEMARTPLLAAAARGGGLDLLHRDGPIRQVEQGMRASAAQRVGFVEQRLEGEMLELVTGQPDADMDGTVGDPADHLVAEHDLDLEADLGMALGEQFKCFGNARLRVVEDAVLEADAQLAIG